MADKYNDSRTSLPVSYVRYIEAHGGWEGDLGDDLGYVVLWDPTSIQDRWKSYQMAEFLGERSFPFGSDGGDEDAVLRPPVWHRPRVPLALHRHVYREGHSTIRVIFRCRLSYL